MDFSTASTLLSCGRRYEYSNIEKRADESIGGARGFGHLWHKIVELYGIAKINGLSLDPGPILGRATDETRYQDNMSDPVRTLGKAALAFDRWLGKHAPGYEWLETEQVVVENAGGHEPMEGKIDAIVKHAGQIWVVDYKTTARLDQDWVAQYRNSNQFAWYYFMKRKKYGEELAGVIVDLLHVTKGNRRGESEGEQEGCRLYQLHLTFSEDKINEAIRDFQTAVELKEFYEARKYFPRNTTNCKAYNRTCAFLDVCDLQNHDLRRDLLDSMPENTFNLHGE